MSKSLNSLPTDVISGYFLPRVATLFTRVSLFHLLRQGDKRSDEDVRVCFDDGHCWPILSKSLQERIDKHKAVEGGSLQEMKVEDEPQQLADPPPGFLSLKDGMGDFRAMMPKHLAEVKEDTSEDDEVMAFALGIVLRGNMAEEIQSMQRKLKESEEMSRLLSLKGVKVEVLGRINESGGGRGVFVELKRFVKGRKMMAGLIDTLKDNLQLSGKRMKWNAIPFTLNRTGSSETTETIDETIQTMKLWVSVDKKSLFLLSEIFAHVEQVRHARATQNNDRESVVQAACDTKGLEAAAGLASSARGGMEGQRGEQRAAASDHAAAGDRRGDACGGEAGRMFGVDHLGSRSLLRGRATIFQPAGRGGLCAC